MANSYSLADINAALEAQYEPLVIEGVTFRNVMRLSKDVRKQVMDAVEAVNADRGEDDKQDLDVVLDHVKTILTLVADKDASKVISAIGDDIAIGMHIMSLWTAATQPGEASSSPS